MMYRTLILIFLCMAVFQVPANASNNYDVTYCYTCDMADMERRAAAMLGEAKHKTVAVINYRTDAITSFTVFDASEPGFYSIIATPTATPVDFQQLIKGTIQKFRAIKALRSVNTAVLPGNHRDNFPRTAHDLVGSLNNRGILLSSVEDFLTIRAEHSVQGSMTGPIVKIVNQLVGKGELVGQKFLIKFSDGSSVEVKVAGLSINLMGQTLIVDPEYVPNSLEDNVGNKLPFDAKDLAGERYSVGGGVGGHGNILAWRSMLNRLRSLGHFRRVNCEWEDENHVVCTYK